MAVTNADAAGQAGAPRKRTRKQTTLDEHVDRPSVVEPGDAPFDTTDPTERATSVMPDFAAAAREGHGTVNAVIPLKEPEPAPVSGEKAAERTEEYHAQRPDGSWVKVKHNIDTGETEPAN